MDSLTASHTSILKLARGLVGETKTLARQQVDLFKTEISEKISSMGRNSVSLAIGGVAAFAGLLVFLVGLGWLLTFAFAAAGLSQLLASFVGMGVIGLLVMLLGGAFIAKALSSFKKQPLAPQRSLQTLHDLRGGQAAKPKTGPEEEETKRSSAEIQVQVQQTEQRMGEGLDELGRRLSPVHIGRRVKYRIEQRPYHAGLIVMIAGVVGGLALRRKLRRA